MKKYGDQGVKGEHGTFDGLVKTAAGTIRRGGPREVDGAS